MRWLILIAALACGRPVRVAAHGDVHPIIVDLTAKIAAEPTNARLYLERGELYRVDGNWKDAAADYDQAARNDPRLTAVDLCRGRMSLDAGNARIALAALDRFVAVQPEAEDGYLYRGRAKAQLKDYSGAAADFSQAIARAKPPRPELYLERAEVLRAAGPAQADEALRTLDAGIQKLGPLVTLELPAIEVEVAARRFDAALARLDKLAAQSPRKEPWLLRRGEILEKAGRGTEARVAYQAAFDALQSLPPSRRGTRATVELAGRIKDGLQRTAVPNNPASHP